MTKITVTQANQEDWQFVFIDAGNGKRQMSVF
jgi:hypothetical protein